MAIKVKSSPNLPIVNSGSTNLKDREFNEAQTAVLSCSYSSNCLLMELTLYPGGLCRHPNIGDVSWIVSTPRSPVPASLHLVASQLKPSMSGLRASERPLFHFGFNPSDATGTQKKGVCLAEMC